MTDNKEIIDTKWYVVQTLSNKEQAVKRYLDRYLVSEEMDDYIKEVLMPTETITEVKNGKKSQKVRNFILVMYFFTCASMMMMGKFYTTHGIS